MNRRNFLTKLGFGGLCFSLFSKLKTNKINNNLWCKVSNRDIFLCKSLSKFHNGQLVYFNRYGKIESYENKDTVIIGYAIENSDNNNCVKIATFS